MILCVCPAATYGGNDNRMIDDFDSPYELTKTNRSKISNCLPDNYRSNENPLCKSCGTIGMDKSGVGILKYMLIHVLV